MTTEAQILELMERCFDLPPPEYILVHPRWNRMMRKIVYGPLLRPLPRFRGVRGRKRSILWRWCK